MESDPKRPRTDGYGDPYAGYPPAPAAAAGYGYDYPPQQPLPPGGTPQQPYYSSYPPQQPAAPAPHHQDYWAQQPPPGQHPVVPASYGYGYDTNGAAPDASMAGPYGAPGAATPESQGGGEQRCFPRVAFVRLVEGWWLLSY